MENGSPMLSRDQSPNSVMRSSCRERVIGSYNSGCSVNSEHSLEMSHGSSLEIMRDVVKVEIADIEGDSSVNMTITALRRCELQIVGPFHKLLMLIGWRRLGSGRVTDGSLRWRLISSIYLTVMVGLMLFSYVYQILACEWGLSPSDLIPLTTRKPEPTTTPSNNTTPGVVDWFTMEMAKVLSTTVNASELDDSLHMPMCEHLFTTYVVPNLLHAIAYALGLLHFRLKGAENLYALMEKVFLYCQSSPTRQMSQMMLIRRLRAYILAVLLWVLLAMATHVLNDIGFVKFWGSTRNSIFKFKNGEDASYVLLVLDMAGHIFCSFVAATVVLNYVVNCEMIVFYADSVRNKLQERSLNLRVAVKDLYAIKMATKQLNGTTALTTSIILVAFLELIVLGTSILIKNRLDEPVVWTYRVFFVAHLLPLVVLPLVQAARVNSHCSKFQEMALEMRTFGYQNAGQLELDSIVLFVMANRIQAKLFHVPILPSYLIVLTVITSFVFLTLLQDGHFIRNSIL